MAACRQLDLSSHSWAAMVPPPLHRIWLREVICTWHAQLRKRCHGCSTGPFHCNFVCVSFAALRTPLLTVVWCGLHRQCMLLIRCEYVNTTPWSQVSCVAFKQRSRLLVGFFKWCRQALQGLSI